jgi:carboxypeptidase Taq
MHIADEITGTPVGTGTSMGMHEGQSRLFENNFGRSRAFWVPLFEKLKAAYPENLSDITLDQFILGINKSTPSLIRTEADELTYCLHIMVRYEIEKLIFEDKVTVEDLPKIWNEKYEEYLGVTPPTDTEGILQDIHWATGAFGYFPSYALGSAYSAQMLRNMEQEIDVWGNVSKGNLAPVTAWLKDKVHKYGCLLEPGDIVIEYSAYDFRSHTFVYCGEGLIASIFPNVADRGYSTTSASYDDTAPECRNWYLSYNYFRVFRCKQYETNPRYKYAGLTG